MRKAKKCYHQDELVEVVEISVFDDRNDYSDDQPSKVINFFTAVIYEKS
jgi:hypothetical protein